MNIWKKSKGNRIRASDKSLLYHFCIGWLLLLFVAVFLLLNLRQLLVIDWKDFNLLHAGITWTAYNVFCQALFPKKSVRIPCF